MILSTHDLIMCFICFWAPYKLLFLLDGLVTEQGLLRQALWPQQRSFWRSPQHQQTRNTTRPQVGTRKNKA